MKWLSTLSVLSVLFLWQNASAESPKDSEAIQGVWAAASAELGGKPFPDEIRKALKLTIQRNRYSVTAGENADQGTIKLDESSEPKGMEIIGTAGPNKDKTIPAIYRLRGDTLEICYDLLGQNRPEDFKTEVGTQLFLVVYKRAK